MNELFKETETAIVKVNASDYGLDETKAAELIKNLPQIIKEREVFVSQFDQVIRKDIEALETAKEAHDLRLRIRDNRTKGIEVWHKTTKDYFLKGGQFVDAIRRKESAVNERMETDLEKIEKYQEIRESKRLEKLRVDRLEMLKPYTEIEPLALGHMEQAVFDNLLAGFRVAYEARVAEEKKAEEERIAREKAEAEAREAQRLENIRLKAEADKKQAELEAERKAVRLAQEKRDAELAMERARVQKEREELEAKVRKEREERERIEAQLKAKQDAERKAESARIAQEKAEAKRLKLAPDKTKLINFAQAINDLPRPDVKSIEAADIASKANIKLFEVAAYIRDNANKL